MVDGAWFWNRVDRSGDCWNWTGAKVSKGYGSLGAKGKIYSAHRMAYQLANGPIPPGMCVCHSCDNPACCNPDHLWLGTNADNVADRQRKGRSNGGCQPGSAAAAAKLNEKQAKEIRNLLREGKTQRHCAALYGVHFGTINDLALRKTWRHVA